MCSSASALAMFALFQCLVASLALSVNSEVPLSTATAFTTDVDTGTIGHEDQMFADSSAPPGFRLIAMPSAREQTQKDNVQMLPPSLDFLNHLPIHEIATQGVAAALEQNKLNPSNPRVITIEKKRGNMAPKMQYFNGHGGSGAHRPKVGMSDDLEQSIRRIVQDILQNNEDFFFKVPLTALSSKPRQRTTRFPSNYQFMARAPMSTSSKEVTYLTTTQGSGSDRGGGHDVTESPASNELTEYYMNYQRGLGSGLKNLAAFVKTLKAPENRGSYGYWRRPNPNGIPDADDQEEASSLIVEPPIPRSPRDSYKRPSKQLPGHKQHHQRHQETSNFVSGSPRAPRAHRGHHGRTTTYISSAYGSHGNSERGGGGGGPRLHPQQQHHRNHQRSSPLATEEINERRSARGGEATNREVVSLANQGVGGNSAGSAAHNPEFISSLLDTILESSGSGSDDYRVFAPRTEGLAPGASDATIYSPAAAGRRRNCNH